jgi:hypothetical protein
MTESSTRNRHLNLVRMGAGTVLDRAGLFITAELASGGKNTSALVARGQALGHQPDMVRTAIAHMCETGAAEDNDRGDTTGDGRPDDVIYLPGREEPQNPLPDALDRVLALADKLRDPLIALTIREAIYGPVDPQGDE